MCRRNLCWAALGASLLAISTARQATHKLMTLPFESPPKTMQSLPQLLQVGKDFKEDVTSAPNTKIRLRTQDAAVKELQRPSRRTHHAD